MEKFNERLILRKITEEDGEIISKAFEKQGWNKLKAQFQKYFEYQKDGVRDIIVAELDGDFAGYLTINWTPGYDPFFEKKIPEVVDFNVLKKYQRQGIGTALMNEAEKRIKKVSEFAGIGVGVMKDYGAAQILYHRRGYVPNGNGVTQNSVPLEYGEQVTVDHSLVFNLIKKL